MTDPTSPNVKIAKLRDSMSGVIGKTISDIVIITNPPGKSHLFLVFTDGTHYELYDIDSLNGARAVDRGGVAQIASRVGERGECVVITKAPLA
jgi:hypothetical protein